jgi:hypothetical protein
VFVTTAPPPCALPPPRREVEEPYEDHEEDRAPREEACCPKDYSIQLVEATDTDEDIEINDQGLTEEAVLVKVKDNPDRTEKKQRRAPKKRHLNVIKETTDLEAVFDEVMK